MRANRPDTLAALVLAATLATALACSGDGDETGPGLSITPSEASVSVGGSVQLSALNANGTVAWTSSDDATAGVVSTGFVTGKKPGRVTITAKDSRGSVDASITVMRPAALGLSANSLAFTVVSGGTEATQTVQVTDAGDDKVGIVSVASVTFASGQPTGWLTATLAATSAPTQLSVRVSPSSLAPGTYSATISVAAGGATNGPQSIVVTATVGTPPTLVLSSTNVTFNGTRGAANPPAQTVNVTNGGTGTITALATTITYASNQPNGWLAASLNGTVAPAALNLTATVGTLADGTYSATVAVAGAGAANSPRQITVTLIVGPGPSIGLSTTTVAFNAPIGGANPSTQTVTITNAGGGSLTGLATGAVSYASGQGWLTTLSLSGTTAPATLTLGVTVGSLATGTYTATVPLSSPVASNSPRTITVTLTVGPPPSLVLGSTSISISAQKNGTSSSVTVSITSTGAVITGITSSTTYGSGSGWLTASLSGSATPATLNVQAAAGSLAPGTYTATVSVASPNAVNSPRTLTVTFNVLYSLTTDIFPAIGGYCTGCHFSGGSPPNLANATNFYNNLVNAGTTIRTGYPLATTHPARIAPGNANASYVVDQIARAAGAYPMPPSGAAVPANVLNLLIAWINQGAPNN